MNKKEMEHRHRMTQGEGERADRLMKDPLIVEFFENEKELILEKLAESKMDEQRERELVLYLKATRRFERNFEEKIRKGNKAKTLLQQLLKR